MKNTLVYCLEQEGTTAIHFSIEDLCEALKYEFNEYTDEDAIETKFNVSAKMMTEKEIKELPEFDGF